MSQDSNKENQAGLVCSVVIPMYNAESFIKNTISSVQNQTIKNIEIICVDDCSTDNTAKIVEELLQTDPRIVLLKNEENMKVSATRNHGIQFAHSDWVALLDADDMWEQEFLQKVLEKREEKNADIVVSSESFMSHDGERLDGEFIVKDEITYKDLLKQNSISCSAVLVKKQLLLDNPFYADDVHEDYLCWLNIVKKIGKVYGVKEPLSVRRLTEGSKSRNKFKAIQMSYKTYKKHGLNFFKRLYCTFCNGVNGLKKYGGIKKKK